MSIPVSENLNSFLYPTLIWVTDDPNSVAL